MADRCTAMLYGTMRCTRQDPHGGYHRNGGAEWIDPAHVRIVGEPCLSVVIENGQPVQCECAAGHKNAHRGHGLIWTGPCPLPVPRGRYERLR